MKWQPLRAFGFFSIAVLASTCLTGCSSLFTPDTVVSEDEFSITHDTLFVTQLSPAYRDMDSAPGVNTSYLVAIEKGGTVKALKVEPMESGDPQFMGDTLVAIDRKYDYFINNTVTKREHKKSETTTEMAVSSNGNNVFALMNEGYEPDGETYRTYAETISDSNSTRPVELEGIFLTASECQGALYAVGDATGRLISNPANTYKSEGTAFVQATNTGSSNEKVISFSKSLSSDTVGSLLPCIGSEIVHFYEDEYTLNSGKEPDGGFIRLRNIHNGDTSDKRFVDQDGNDLKIDRPGLISGAEYDRTNLTDDTVYWYGEDGGYWETNIRTGATQKLFTIPEPQEFIDAATVGFSPKAIHLLHSGDNGTVVKSYSKEDGSVVQELNVEGFDELYSGSREFWNLTVAPWVD